MATEGNAIVRMSVSDRHVATILIRPMTESAETNIPDASSVSGLIARSTVNESARLDQADLMSGAAQWTVACIDDRLLVAKLAIRSGDVIEVKKSLNAHTNCSL